MLASVVGAPNAKAQSAPTLSVDIASNRHPISPNIYGIANYGLDATFAQEIKVPNIRWGGDGTTRYNWQVDSSNAGFDWYFMGGSGTANPVPGAGPDLMINTYKPAGAGALITVPIIPYVNKLSAWNCSFPVSVYGAQQSTNPYVHPNGDDCGNSIATNGTQLLDTNIYANHIDNSVALQQGWIQHLVNTFGTASQGGVPFYQLDNEPSGWANTHRDVEPNAPTYDTIISLGQPYAAMIKAQDPTASVLGPSDFTLGGWIGTPSQQNNLYAGQYYLQKMAAYEQQNGQRILDYFDEHYYPEFSDATSQLASTRTLWDPTYNGGTWVEQYYFDGPMQLIPRFQQWISQYYPGTKLSISEYSIDSGNKLITDALAEMDVLGIYGRQQLDFANMWNTPAPTDPIAYAFRMYRNYDGSGSQYGDTWISATSSDQSQLSIYASQRSADNVVTMVVINKTTAAINTTLQLAGATLPASASVYSYSGAKLNQIVQGANAAIGNGKITYNFPGYSATLFAFAPAPGSLTTTTTALTASATQVVAGQSVTFTAAVSGNASLTGTVTFNDGSVTIGTGTLASGHATLSTSALAVGIHSITAVYNGDANDAASTSSTLQLTVSAPTPVVTPTSTTLSASSTRVVVAQSVVFTASVSGTSGPTGTVTFSDGSTALGAGTIVSGKAFFSDSALSVGTHSIKATYAGDASNAASTSNLIVVTVATPAPALAATTTTLTASSAQISAGQSFQLHAVVSGTGSPTGSVTFNNGTVTLAAATLVNGAASATIGGLSPNTYSITAAYGGDANDLSSVSSPVTLVVAGTSETPPPASFSLSLSQNTMVVAAGASGQMGLSISPQNGFNSSVNLACSGLPAGATCSFSPSSLSPASSTTSNLTIATSANASLFGASLVSPWLISLFFQRKRRWKGILLGMASLLLMTGCGLSVNSAGNATPNGSYTVHVTATAASGETESQSIILTIQ